MAVIPGGWQKFPALVVVTLAVTAYRRSVEQMGGATGMIEVDDPDESQFRSPS